MNSDTRLPGIAVTDADTTPGRDPRITPDVFKAAFRHHPAGVAVITADDGDGPVGMTVTSVSSVSAEPPLLVFSASALSSSTPAILGAETIVVHFIDAGCIDIGRLCATSGIDRFADTTMWSRMPTGEPYFTSVPNRLRCRIVHRMEAGLSTVAIAQVIEATDAESHGPVEPLVYHNRGWYRLTPDALI